MADDQISVNRETVEKGDEGEEVELLRLIVPGGKRSFVRLLRRLVTLGQLRVEVSLSGQIYRPQTRDLPGWRDLRKHR